MANTTDKTLDEAIAECEECGETVLAAYIEDGRCHHCRE